MKKNATIAIKKAQISPSIILWVLRLVLLTIALLVIPLTINAYLNAKVDVKKIEGTIIANRIARTPLLHANTAYGTDPFIYDLQKFSPETEDLLMKELDFGKNQRAISAKIGIYSNDEQQLLPLSEIYFNKKLYKDLEVQQRAGIYVRGQAFKRGVGETLLAYPAAFIDKEGKINQGFIKISVLQQK